MALSAARKAYLRKFGGRSLAKLIRFVGATREKITEPPNILEFVHKDGPCIVACWHGQFMMMSSFHSTQYPTAAMVARHGDAALIGHAVEDFGVELIRGAGAGGRRKDRGGTYALRAAQAALAAGKSIVMTADVPPGPARRAGEGIVKLAMLSGRPIVPAAVASSRYHAFKTWSRMTLNLPFSKLASVAAPHIYAPAHADERQIEMIRRQVEDALNGVTARAYELAGADPARATPPVVINGREPLIEPGFGLKTYQTLTRALEPVAPIILRSRSAKGKEDPARRDERLGRAAVARPVGPLAWLHAASVGETNAVLPVIEKLGNLRPDLHFLLTTGTVTSARIASQRLGPRAIHQFAPLDGPRMVAKFLDHWHPDIAVFTESDVWPNLILEASVRAIPLALVNGRISDRSFSRWRRNKGLAQPLFSRFDIVLAQDDKLARRFQKIGARFVQSVGNLKIDAPPPPVDQAALNNLAHALQGRPCYIAASTHEGEEEIVGQAHRILARRIEGFVTLLAPRHPERGTAIAEMLKGAGLNVMQRSTGHLPSNTCDIYIADTLGELGTFFEGSPIAFMGGSIIDKGGQNPIEAIRRGAAIISGPYRQNQREVFETLARHDAVVTVTNAGELAEAIEQLIFDPARLDAMRARGSTAVSNMSGALERTVATLLELLQDHRNNLHQDYKNDGQARAS